MGWLFTRGATRKDIITKLILGGSWTRTEDNAVIEHNVLRHTSSGNILWTVEEFHVNGVWDSKIIGCYLLQRSPDGWGYKAMDESFHPYYYTCPLSYLAACSETSAEWRAGVRRYWQERKEIRALRKERARNAQVSVRAAGETKDGGNA